MLVKFAHVLIIIGLADMMVKQVHDDITMHVTQLKTCFILFRSGRTIRKKMYQPGAIVEFLGIYL